MMRIALPILPSSMALGKALDLLREMHISGLVTEIAGRPTVLDADALLKGTAVADTILGKITPSYRTIDFEDWQPDLRAVQDQNRAAAMLDSGAARFGFAGAATPGGEIGLVVTRSEGFAADLRIQMAYCVCTGPGRHFCAPGDALITGECNDCSSPLDCG